MNCRTAILTIAAAGDLVPEEAAALASHLRSCARCRAEEEFASRITTVLAVDPGPVPARDFTARVLGRIQQAETAPGERVWMPLVPAAALVSAIGAAWLAFPLLPWREVMQALGSRALPPLTGPAALAPYAAILPALVVGSVALLTLAAREFVSFMRE
jgi:hypothetical protein